MPAAGSKHLARAAQDAFERRGDYESLLFEGRWHRSGELFTRARAIATGLVGLGLQAGDRVAVTMANCPEVGVVYQAVWRAGLVATPATFLLGTEDLRHVLRDSGARAVVTTSELLDKVRTAAADIDPRPHLICTEHADGVTALGELETAPPGEIVPRADDDLAALLYTGGTTGRAKGVMLSHAALHWAGSAAYASSHVDGVNRSLGALPLSHAYGLLITVSGFHSSERDVSVLLRWFDPDVFLRAVQEHRLQRAAVVPSMLQALLARPLQDYDLSSLRYVTSGASPLPPETERAFAERVPSVSIRQGYGLTESGALVATNPVGRMRSGSVGVPVPGCVVEIRDGRGRPLPVGEVGEICVRSPGLMTGYWRAPETTAKTIREGWLRTGDVGRFDEDGYLYVVDRLKDLIIRGGFNVYPRDVEDALVEHPDVAMAGVVGAPSDSHGEEVVAFVSPRGGAQLDAERLVQWSRERIGGYKYPRRVHVLDELPLTAVGKVDRKALRARLQRARDR
ncbi:MAG TPA: AMP-binding protein [Solirubrobacteraceae bacterium]|nr:AMP-binding protein [Solirubrobacteraceae bacterium]